MLTILLVAYTFAICTLEETLAMLTLLPSLEVCCCHFCYKLYMEMQHKKFLGRAEPCTETCCLCVFKGSLISVYFALRLVSKAVSGLIYPKELLLSR